MKATSPLLPRRTPGLGVGGGINAARRIAVSAAVLAVTAAAVLVVAVLSTSPSPSVRSALAQWPAHLQRTRREVEEAAAEQRDHTRWWEHGSALVVSEAASTSRKLHGYFWAVNGRRSASANLSQHLATVFAGKLRQHRGLLDGLVVVGAVKSRVVIAADDPRLSYLLLEPVYTVAPNKGVWPPASNKGVRPPELQPLWDEARRQGMALFGALAMVPTNWSFVGPNASAPEFKDISNPSYPWHKPAREWFRVDVYHEDFARRSLQPTVDSIVRSCSDLGLAGVSINDESGWWKPRSSRRDLVAFVRYVSMLAHELHKYNLKLFVTMALPYEMGVPEEDLKRLLHDSAVDRWLFMDPYWGTVAHTEEHLLDWSAPYVHSGLGGIGHKYSPILWNHPAEQFGSNSSRPMEKIVECIAVNTSIHDVWVWGFPQVLDATRFISALANWKFGSGERH